MNLSLNEAYKALKVLDRSGEVEAGAILHITGDNITDYNSNNDFYKGQQQFHPSIRRYEDYMLNAGEWTIGDYMDYRKSVMTEVVDKIGMIYSSEAKVIITSLIREQQLEMERGLSLW